MIVAEYVNHLWIQVNPSKYSYIHCNLLNNKNNKYYIEAYEYFKERYNLEIDYANYISKDTGVKLKLILKNKEFNVSIINDINENAIIGSDEDNGRSYSYILLDIDQTIEKL